MDGIFSKFVTCCNTVLEQHGQGTIGWVFGNFILHVTVNVAVNFYRQSRYAVPGDYIISCVIFLGAVACVLFNVYKPVTAPPASDLACSTGDAGANIVARTSDGSKKSNDHAVVCSRVPTGSSLGTRLIFLRWTNTFQLRRSALGQPIGRVTEHVSWEGYLGQPMKQPDRATCSLVACTVAVEGINRFVYASSHGDGTPFPWAAAEPLELLQICKDRRIWDKRRGAFVSDVLNLIQEQGGVPLANPPSDGPTVLPLSGWQPYTTDGELTQDRVAKLLSGGPCVGTLWVCPWYYLFDASRNNSWVYWGCGRDLENRKKSESLYGKKVSPHAVVCLGYRRCGDEMHVLVLDNHQVNGPRRWVDVREIDGIYTLTV